VIKLLQIKEVWVNGSADYLIGSSEWYEPFTDNLGKLFKSLRKEYGRCVSRVYQDAPDGTADPIGWVFEKNQRYTDTQEKYLQETWVTHRQVKE
jgi:hypothetical protein